MNARTWTVVFGGPSPEHEISILTGLQAERVLLGLGDAVVPLYWAPTGEWYVVPGSTEARDYLEGVPRGSRLVELRVSGTPGIYERKRLGEKRIEVDAALLTLHGGVGEGGGAAALFSLIGIPATGSNLFAGAVGMDKLAFGGLVQNAGLPSLPRELLSPTTEPTFSGPYIVKPRFGGSSIGIEIVEDVAAARAVAASSVQLRAGGAVVEPYRPGLIDLNIGFRTYPELAVTPVERPLRPEGATVYSYQDKYLGGESAGLMGAPREFPAVLGPGVAELADSLARGVAEVTGLTGVVRVDLLHDTATGDLYVNEVNSIPGAMSLYLWAPSVTPGEVLRDALIEAIERPFSLPAGGFGSGAALRAASGIAAKLVGLGGS